MLSRTLAGRWSGDGWFRLAGGKNGWKVFAAEPSPKAVAFAHDRYGIKMNIGSLEEIDFPSDFFDVVHLNHVLEHVLVPHETLRKINRILRKDGLLVLEVPNELDSFQANFAEVICRYFGSTRESGGHVTFLNPTSVEAAAYRCGFEKVLICTFYPGCGDNFNGFRSRYPGGRLMKYILGRCGGLAYCGPLVEYYGRKIIQR